MNQSNISLKKLVDGAIQPGSEAIKDFLILQTATWRYFIYIQYLLAMKENKNSIQLNLKQQVIHLFQEMNQVQTITKAQVFQLIKLFKHNPLQFQQGWQLAYLRIFKIFHQRANRKMPQKYQNLASNFFNELMPKDADADAASRSFYDYFIEFLAEGVFSQLAGIRITTTRMLFHLLKGHASFAGEKAKQKVLKSVFFLVRLKVSTYKQVGIKLASIALCWKGTLQKKIQEEFFKIMSTEQNQQIRKMAMINILINGQNLDRILIRLRDKCTEIRGILVRKLVGQKFPLTETNLVHRLRLLYDGYGNKEVTVQQDTLKYFMQFFQKPKYDTFVDFINMFQPKLLLSQPQLYCLFERLLIDILEQLPLNSVEDFIRQLSSELKNCAKGNKMNSPVQIIWFKAIAKSQNKDLKALFQEQIPSGMELAKLLSQLINSRQIFSIYECLQIIRLYRSADEIGRNKMFQSLKNVINNMDNWETNRQAYENIRDDVCYPLTASAIKQKKLLISYFDLPLITCSFDLILQAGHAMKGIWPDHYEIELKQLMSDWNDPQENTLIKEKQLAQANIRKVEQTNGDRQILVSLRNKLKAIEDEIEKQGIKTKIMIMTIMRLRPTASMQDYMSIIKQELNKEEQHEGLILLGLYCLQERQLAQNFLPLYWAHVTKQPIQKLHLLVSLRVLTDIFIKFDFSKLEPSQSNLPDFSYSKFINKIMQFILSQDGDIRKVSIESLCRLLYHSRVNQQKLMSCFMRLLLLWWQTNSQEISAHSVHTISIFIKQYLQKGRSQIRKLAEFLCIFFKMIILSDNKGQSINKSKVVYNLKTEQFVKRSVTIAMTVMKYHKESKQITWKYQEDGAQLGPQEMLLLFLFKEQKMHFCLQKAISICDFYEEAPLQTLILVKKQVQTFIEVHSSQIGKKLQSILKKLQSDLEDRIQIKNRETFNQQLLTGLKQELNEYNLLIETSGVAVTQELSAENILVQNKNIDAEREEDQMSEQIEELQPHDLEGFQQEFLMNEIKRQGQGNKKLNRISQKLDQQPESDVKEEDKKERIQLARKSGGIKQQKIEDKSIKKENRRANRKKMPSPIEHQPSVQGETQKIISGRTRSKINL